MKLIVCTNSMGIIGRDIDGSPLVYSIKEDMTKFRDCTKQGEDPHIVMGRTTYDTIGKALPNRVNIVLSRDKDLELPGCIVMTLTEFVHKYEHHSNMWVIGGGQIYSKLLPYVDIVYMTHVLDDDVADLIDNNFSLVYFTNTFLKIKRVYKEVTKSPWRLALDRVSGKEKMVSDIIYRLNPLIK